jgi:hypothetical protein
MEMEARTICIRKTTLCKTETGNGMGRRTLEKYGTWVSLGTRTLAIKQTRPAKRTFLLDFAGPLAENILGSIPS